MASSDPQAELPMDPALFLATSAGDSYHEQAAHLGVVPGGDDDRDDDDPWGSFVAWSYDQEVDPSWLEE